MSAATPIRPDPDKQVKEWLKVVYDCYRRALLNKKYYADRLEHTKKWSTTMECLVVIGTSGAIATWAVWRTSAGQIAWAIITATATVIAGLKPILKFPDRVEKYTKLVANHFALFDECDQLVQDIRTRGEFTDQMWKTFQETQNRSRKLGLDDDPRPLPRLVEKFTAEVNREIKSEDLWWPTQEYSLEGKAPVGQ
jgi:hypothetical protein